ncbi:hypothetical protein BGZ65_011690, partial [Modicella reniformis]
MSSKRIATGETIFANQLFTKQELVGRGAYGAVYKGIENATQQVVAIKVLNLDTEEEDVSDIQREIATLSQLKNCDSQNITRYHGSFLNGTKLWIVMDYAAGGSIRSLLQTLKGIDEKCIAVIAREVLQALSYLHKHGIIHRDIKAANILLTDEGRVQLCDFGVAGQVTMNSLKRNSFVGTPYWMAPEVIREGQTYDYKADIWSFGITIYEIATGNPPFADQDPMRAVSLIPKSRPAQLEGDWSLAMKEFVAHCLHEEPNERPSAEDLLKTTKWIKNNNKNSTALLKDLVAKFEEQNRTGSAHHKDEANSDIDIDQELESFDNEPDAWRFDTTKTVLVTALSRTPSISRRSLDPKGEHTNGAKSPILSAQDSGVVMQGRNGQMQGAASVSYSGPGSSPTVKASPTSSKPFKKPLPLKPPPISHEAHHPLQRLFMNHKSASEEDVSISQPTTTSHGLYPVSAPMTLTIPNLEEITSARLASRSPAPTMESSSTCDQAPPSGQYQQYQHQSTAPNRPTEAARLPFGMGKPFKSDRRPSAPVLNNSALGPDHPLYNHHVFNRGTTIASPLSSPRAVPPPPQTSILANMHTKQGTQDPDPSTSLPQANKGSFSAEIIIPSHHQVSMQQSLRPSSTPSSPAFSPTTIMGSTSTPANGTAATTGNTLSTSKDQPRLSGQRRPSPTMLSSMMAASQQQQSRAPSDARNNLPPSIPHRKASLDFSQAERQSHLRAALPMRPPSAAAVRSSTFHGLGSVPAFGVSQTNESTNSLPSSLGNTIAGLSSGVVALGMQPINISEEKLPPFGHSPAHLRMLNGLPDNPPTHTAMHEHNRGSITSSEKDGLSPALSVNSDPTFGQMHSSSLPNHNSSLSSSSASSVSSTSVPTSAPTNSGFGAAGPGPSPGAMARPGLRTVGSSENFARRIRSASMLRKNEDQEGQTKSGFQSSRPHATVSYSAQQSQQPTVPQGHYHQHPAYQQQQYSYTHEPHSTDIHRYRRASSPRRRSISMTNLNGGLSFIMVPSKKSSIDDYAPNPLLLPPSPSTARFIGSSSVGVSSTLSSSPLRPTLHSMASSSSLSSSFGSVSGAVTSAQANGGVGNGATHGHQQTTPGPSPSSHGSSSLPSSAPTNISTSPTSQPLSTNDGNHHVNNMSSTATVSNANPKSVMNIANLSSANVSTTAT